MILVCVPARHVNFVITPSASTNINADDCVSQCPALMMMMTRSTGVHKRELPSHRFDSLTNSTTHTNTVVMIHKFAHKTSTNMHIVFHQIRLCREKIYTKYEYPFYTLLHTLFYNISEFVNVYVFVLMFGKSS